MRSILFSAILMVFAVPVAAQEKQEEPSKPCSSARYSDFDFWLGHWNVHSEDGAFQGVNVIEKAENGCLIIERWMSANNGTGQSYNYFNPETEIWHQVWVSRGSIIEYEGGLIEPGHMRLVGQITYQSPARSAAFTGEWKRLENGNVRQHFEEFDEATNSWNPWFTGIYSRVSDNDVTDMEASE